MAVRSSSRPFIMAGDWNVDVADFKLAAKHWLDQIGGVVIGPEDWTCRTGDTYSAIDFFVVSKQL
eukprot:9338278-Karenia_brevis.AAC.1